MPCINTLQVCSQRGLLYLYLPMSIITLCGGQKLGQLKGSVEELSKFPKGVIKKNGFKVSNLYMRDSDSLHA